MKSPASSNGRRDSSNSISGTRQAAQPPPLFTKERMERGSRRALGVESVREKEKEKAAEKAKEDKADKKGTKKQEEPVEEEEDELDASDLESEEGAGVRRSTESRRLESEKDGAEFAYEYVPVKQRRENRDKM